MKDVVLLLLLALCRPTLAEDAPLTIAAAASLRDVLPAAGALYEKDTGQTVHFSFDASGLLARQIENGAPVDLFISADPQWLDYLAERDLIDSAARQVVARNRLVAIQPAAHDVFVGGAEDLLLLNRVAIGDPESVPAGRYARQFMESAGLWTQIQERLVFASNVRAALALAERGEVGAAMVFATDARAVTSQPGVRVSFAVDPARHAPIVYEAAIPRAAPHRVAALKFLWILETPEAKALFEQTGFTPP